MTIRWLAVFAGALAGVLSAGALAQRASEVADLEPAVDTSAGLAMPGRVDDAAAVPASDSAALPASVSGASPERSDATASDSVAPDRPVAARAGASLAAGAASTPVSGRTPVAIDRLDLGTTSITGNQELPKVLYIVPWKQSDLGELIGRPVNTLLDEVLAPVDRRVFDRHLSYYEALHGDSQQE